MKFPRLFGFAGSLVAASCLALAAQGAARPSAVPAPGAPVYVAIEYTSPIRFDRLRYSLMTGDELVLATLKNSATEQARVAGYDGDVIVLDEDAKAPEGAAVMTLTWFDDAVTAVISANGASKYLGVVNRAPLSEHPDYATLQRSIKWAPAELHRDTHLEARLKVDLWKAFALLVRYQKNMAAKTG